MNAPGPAQEVVAPMQEPAYRHIALRRNLEIAAWALVDAEDFDSLKDFCWRVDKGYALTVADGHNSVAMHRMILGLSSSDPWVDHINGDKLDNRRANLRLASNSQNQQNRQKADQGSSRYRGVGKHKSTGKWQAYGSELNGKRRHLGLFEDERDAALAAAEFRAEHMPYSPDARRKAAGLPLLP